jgi:hypothetical protein
MTVSFPLGISARGSGAVWFLPAIVAPGAPKVAEFTAGINLSCAISGFAPTAEQGTVNKTRYCSRGTFEVPGTVTNTGPTLEYVYDPQEPDSTEYEWFSTLVRGTTGFLVNRLGMDFEDVVAAAQYVNVYPAEAGVQVPVPIDPTADGDELRISQRFFITGDVYYSVAVAT